MQIPGTTPGRIPVGFAFGIPRGIPNGSPGEIPMPEYKWKSWSISGGISVKFL